MELVVRKLELGDQVSKFDCGDEPLNSYLRNYALPNQERHMFGTTYVALLHVSGEIVGYYTIASTDIPKEEVPEDERRGQPKYPNIPALLLCRLAVAKRLFGHKIGDRLIGHCLTTCMGLCEHVGARYIITEAYPSAVTWYEKYNFRAIAGGNPSYTKMYLDIAVVKEAAKMSCEA